MPNPSHKREVNYSSDDGHPWEPQDNGDKPVLNGGQTASLKGQKLPAELLFGQTLNWYFTAAVWPMFILLLIEIGLRVVQAKYLSLWTQAYFDWAVNLARLILFTYLAVSARKVFKATGRQIMAVSVLGGFFAGLIMALFNLAWQFELWKVFNLIGQPLAFALAGLVISWLYVRIFVKI